MGAGVDPDFEKYNDTITQNEGKFATTLKNMYYSGSFYSATITKAYKTLKDANEKAAITLAQQKNWKWGSNASLEDLQVVIGIERNKSSSTPLSLKPSGPVELAESTGKNVINTTTSGIPRAPITKDGPITPNTLTKDRENYQKSTRLTQTQAGLAVVAGVAALGTISAAAILAWYANDNSACYQILDGVRGEQMPGGPGTGNYYDWNEYRDRCTCSPTNTYIRFPTGATVEVIGATGATSVPAFCSNIFSKKNTPGAPIKSGTGVPEGAGATGAGATDTAAGTPPYPACEPIAAEACADNIYYFFYSARPLSLITSAFTTAEQAAGSVGMNVITIGIILAFIALVLFIVLNFITKPKGT